MRGLPFLYRFASPTSRSKLFVECLLRRSTHSARKLVALGLDPNLEVKAGDVSTTPFVVALLHGPLDLVTALLKQGAHVNLRHEQRNALFNANQSELDRDKKLKALVAAGANVNMSLAPSKRTLLTKAAFEGDDRFARFLVRHGADIRRADFHGLTPAKAARLTGRRELLELLQAAGAPNEAPTVEEIESNYLLDRALWSQLHEIVKASLSASGFELASLELEWPAEELVLSYQIRAGATEARLRLEVLEGDRVTLLLFDRATRHVADLLPQGGEVDGARLRAHLVLALGQARTGHFTTPRAKTVPPPRPLTAAEIAAFELLGIDHDAPETEISAAYRRLAKTFHPDVAGPENSAHMQRLNQAYSTLKLRS